MRWSAFVCVVMLAATSADAAPVLAPLRAQVKGLKYAEARRTIEQLAQVPLTRAEVIEALMLEGLVRASLNDEAGAQDAFMRALTLDPDATLPGRLAPRVSTPFLEAKGSAKQSGRLSFSAQSERRLSGDGWSLEAAAAVDPLSQATEVVFTIVEDGLGRTHAGPSQLATTLTGRGRDVTIRWALRNASGWVLLEGTVPVVAPPPPPAPVVAATRPDLPPLLPPEVLRARLNEAAQAQLPTRPTFSLAPGIISLIVGPAALVVGAVFFSQAVASADYARYGFQLTRQEIVAITNEGRTQQTIGGTLLWVGGIAVAAGVTLVILSATSPRVTVSLSPSPGGSMATVGGTF